MAKIKDESEKPQRTLHIKVHKPVPDILDEYCKVAGISPQEIGYCTGFIMSVKDDLATPLIKLNQHFFFAGVYYAHKYKGKYEFDSNMSMEDKEELIGQINKLRKQDNKSNYIG